jgi:antitoxin component HigA of HigAB toxin-antitoxin module
MKSIKPIRTEADYDAALSVIAQLWQAEPPPSHRVSMCVTSIDRASADRSR